MAGKIEKALAVFVAFGLVFGIGYFLIISISSTNNQSSFSSSSMSPQGVVLNVSINNTKLHAGQKLGITVDLFNNLSRVNDVSTIFPLSITSNFSLTAFPISTWPWCVQEPIQFMVVKGNYNLTQLQTMSVNSSYPDFLCNRALQVNSINFEPKSVVVNVSGDFCTANCTYGGDMALTPYSYNFTRLYATFAINGSWTYPLTSSEANDIFTPVPNPGCTANCVSFQYPEVGPIAQDLFSVGKYTLVVEAEWGQTILMHFAVVRH